MSSDEYRAMTLRTQADVNASEALRPILSAGRPARFRALRVVCPRQHRLVDVYTTAKGLAYWAEAGTTWHSIGGGSTRHAPRDHAAVGVLSEQDGARSIEVVCRCRTATIPLAWLRAEAEGPRRRVVWADP